MAVQGIDSNLRNIISALAWTFLCKKVTSAKQHVIVYIADCCHSLLCVMTSSPLCTVLNLLIVAYTVCQLYTFCLNVLKFLESVYCCASSLVHDLVVLG